MATSKRHDRAQPTHPDFSGIGWRAGNAVVAALARLGVGPMQLLTTQGSVSGRPHTVPVVPVDHDGRVWLVAPYGAVAWVRNARANPRLRLRYGRAARRYTAREAAAWEAAPVLKRYVAVATKTRDRFEATPSSPPEDFIADAGRYPVFELIPVTQHTP
jgi:deazaflavin-dependent oxidoreductase (nitroreductase family)